MGGIAVEFEPIKINFEDFNNLLSADMKIDLPHYLNSYANDDITLRTVEEIVKYNKEDSSIRIPYGQALFEGMVSLNLTADEHNQLRTRLHNEGVRYFETPMQAHQLDVILSVNNLNAGFAAAAKYPCLIVPMGYRKSGKPSGLTFIARPFEEDKLLKIGYVFEQATKARKLPKEYK